MRLTVLGGCGAWPAAGSACSGYLVENDPEPVAAAIAATSRPGCSYRNAG